jgi:GNAT superfamily N-acetyltransferase
MEYLIREFQESDIDQLIILCAKHAAHEKSAYDPKDKAEHLKNALLSDNPCLQCWIVVVKDELAGYATFTFDFSTWDARYYLHLDCIYLEEKFRGLGIGKEIMNRLLAAARKKNCINLQWQTPVSNGPAIRFYEGITSNALDKKRFFLYTEGKSPA